MGSLSNEQLAELTERVNERIAEWELPHGFSGVVEKLPRGVVRLVHEVIGEWRVESGKREAKQWEAAFKDGYEAGVYDGKKIARDELAEAQRSNQPVDEDVGDDGPSDDDVEAEIAAARAAVEELVGEEAIAEFLSNNLLKDAAGMPAVSPKAATTLGPEHTSVAPLKPMGDYPPGDDPRYQATPVSQVRSPIGVGRLPAPDAARERLAAGLTQGSGGTLAQAISLPRTLAEVDGLEDDDDDDLDDDLDDEAVDKPKRERPNGKHTPRRRPLGYELAQHPPKGRKGNVLPTVDEVVAELKRQAMGGVMPTTTAFNDARPANWATAQAQMLRLRLTWDGLRELAGLKPNPRSN